uniref:hypothetical protein n=1 Tax=Escherichia coli TaxID=562 RepID=UPI00106FB9E0
MTPVNTEVGPPERPPGGPRDVLTDPVDRILLSEVAQLAEVPVDKIAVIDDQTGQLALAVAAWAAPAQDAWVGMRVHCDSLTDQHQVERLADQARVALS